MRTHSNCPTCTCDGLSDPGANEVGAHHRDPHDTEADAAYQIEPDSGTKRLAVLDAIAEAGSAGLTDFEIVDAIEMHRAPARRHELVLGGWVEDSGLRRETGKGGTAIAWRLTTEGARRLGRSSPRRRRITRTPSRVVEEPDREPRSTPQPRKSTIPTKADERKYAPKPTRRAQSKSPAIQHRDAERAQRAARRAQRASQSDGD